MKNAIKTLNAQEVAHISGAGEAGRKAGEKLARAAGQNEVVVKAAGIVGSAVEDAFKSVFGSN